MIDDDEEDNQLEEEQSRKAGWIEQTLKLLMDHHSTGLI
jgi:hypothetical protein